jgi:hypothetical protein
MTSDANPRDQQPRPRGRVLLGGEMPGQTITFEVSGEAVVVPGPIVRMSRRFSSEMMEEAELRYLAASVMACGA